MRECLLILILSALVGCRAPDVTACRAWSEDRHALADLTVGFAPADSSLSAEAKAKVRRVASYMTTTTNAIVAVRIEGHGDGTGTDRRNYELGDRRAEAVRGELVRLGVDPVLLDTRACGKKARRDPILSPPPIKWRCADFVLLIRPQ